MATLRESFRIETGSDSGGLLTAVRLEMHASGKRVTLQTDRIVDSAELEASDDGDGSGDSVADSWIRAPMVTPRTRDKKRRAEIAMRRRRL